MTESAYAKSRYRPPEIEHRYGPNVHLVDDPLAWTLLARLCALETQQPEVATPAPAAGRQIEPWKSRPSLFRFCAAPAIFSPQRSWITSCISAC